LKTINFFNYYTNFRALFCANYAIRVNISYLRGHLAKHFTRILNKERNQVICKAISIIQLLEVSSLPLSLSAINTFATTYALRPFLELNILENLYKCSFCSFVVSNKKNIKKHLEEKHKEDLLSV